MTLNFDPHASTSQELGLQGCNTMPLACMCVHVVVCRCVRVCACVRASVCTVQGIKLSVLIFPYLGRLVWSQAERT